MRIAIEQVRHAWENSEKIEPPSCVGVVWIVADVTYMAGLIRGTHAQNTNMAWDSRQEPSILNVVLNMHVGRAPGVRVRPDVAIAFPFAIIQLTTA